MGLKWTGAEAAAPLPHHRSRLMRKVSKAGNRRSNAVIANRVAENVIEASTVHKKPLLR